MILALGRGFCQCLVIINNLTRYVRFIACVDRTAETAARAFMEHVVHEDGVPLVLMSDDAAEFKSDVMRHLCSWLGIKPISTLGYNARANGMAEQAWRLWNRSMRMLPDTEYEN